MKTTPWRQRLINELDLRGYAPQSKLNYVSSVRRLAEHFRRGPDKLSDGEIKNYLLYLIGEPQRSRSTMNVVISALRFFYQHVLARSLHEVEIALPRMKRETKRPEFTAPERSKGS